MHSFSPGPSLRSPSSYAHSFADSSSRPLAVVSPLYSPGHSPLVPVSPSRPETARSHATRARPAGWHSVAFSAVHLRVSQSVSQSLSQSVGESGRSGTRERYHAFLFLSPIYPYVTTRYSHLSLSSRPCLSPGLPAPSPLRLFLLPFPSFHSRAFARAGDRVIRASGARHGILLSSLPRALLRVHRPVRDVYFPRSRVRGEGAERVGEGTPRRVRIAGIADRSRVREFTRRSLRCLRLGNRRKKWIDRKSVV